jgi:molybdopterin biosynthesis enzyme
VKAVRHVRAVDGETVAAGQLLTHDVRDAAGRLVLPKGSRLDPAKSALLGTLEWTELHLLALDDGDVHEVVAGERLALAAAGAGVAVGALSAGAWPLEATHRGVLQVRRDALESLNLVDGICVYTLFDAQVVDRGETVARAKIVPFAIEEATLQRGERAARQHGGIVAVRPFLPMTVGAVVQESLGVRAMARFEQALGEKVEWFGSTLLPPAFVSSDVGAVADGLQQVLAQGAQLVALAGSRAMDPLDPAFEALERVGARLVRHGVPAHPGSLVWLAEAGSVPIVGMPACGLFSQATVFDLLLPRLLAGLGVGAPDLAALGHGGFLTRDMAFRFPPYRQARERGAVE